MYSRALHLSKYPLIFMGGFFTNKLLKSSTIIEEYESPRSETIQKFIEVNSLERSRNYEKMRGSLDRPHFVEEGIIKKLEGFGLFNIYFSKPAISFINEGEYFPEDKKSDLCKIYCIFAPNSTVQGHVGVAHGGFTASIIDCLLGQLCLLVNNYEPCVTANLNLNYKKPIYTGKEYVLIAEYKRKEGKKIYLDCKIINSNEEICLEANSLFIAVDWKSGKTNDYKRIKEFK